MKNTLQSLFFLSSLMSTQILAEESAVVLDTIAITPLSGHSTLVDNIPAPIQTVNAKQLQQAQSTSLADYMNRYLGSVHINETQSNPLQPDVYFRGFVASPLLGLPQGLSVYLNGVRVNEAFGDSVNWDLIPQGAINTMTLAPGSNPLFGLNTLGGAISVQTKTGFSAPRHQLKVLGGSWERHSEELSSGWNNGHWGYFIDLKHFQEQGWRDFSPTEANQLFGTLSWQDARTNIDLTLAANDNNMKGNGTVPIQLHRLQRKAVFTHPDQTVNRLFFSELSAQFDLTDTIQLSANSYFRQNRTHSFNGDNSDFEACSFNNGLLCNGEDNVALDVFNQPIAADERLEGATQNTSQTHSRSMGGTFQSVFNSAVFGNDNSLTVGVAYDHAVVHFESDTELSQLTADRGTLGGGVLIQDARVRLNTTTDTFGIYFNDTFSVTDDLTLTLAGRYNNTQLALDNRFITATDKLSGQHRFDRFNPSVGLTYQALDNLNAYSSYSESSRIPTPMELSCANPKDPCKLPNAFIADPPLKQVVAKTWEVGLRGQFDAIIKNEMIRWNAGYFHTINHNDIIFNRGGHSISQGFFSNVGQTERSGVETGLNLDIPQLFSEYDDWSLSTNYTYLKARFLDRFKIQNPLNLGGNQGVEVKSGDRIPGLPEHIYKATIRVKLWQHWSIAMDGQYSSNQFFRGDEANITTPLGGYWVFSARTEVKINDYLSVFGRLNNIFDRDYKTFGVYAQATDVLGNSFNDSRFISPSAPRAGWIGVRLSL